MQVPASVMVYVLTLLNLGGGMNVIVKAVRPLPACQVVLVKEVSLVHAAFWLDYSGFFFLVNFAAQLPMQTSIVPDVR